MKELILIEAKRHKDGRGFFSELISSKELKRIGIQECFVQENHSVSFEPGTLRGFHFQRPPHAQGKLVRCGQGAIFDVAVDIRCGSPTYGKWEGYELSAENGLQLYIPVGFAHGFQTLQPNSEIVYKCTNHYAPEAEGALRWNDPDLDVCWPRSGDPILSEKDALAPWLKDFKSPFIWNNV